MTCLARFNRLWIEETGKHPQVCSSCLCLPERGRKNCHGDERRSAVQHVSGFLPRCLLWDKSGETPPSWPENSEPCQY